MGTTLKIRRTIGWLLAFGLAAYVAGASYVIVNELRAPLSALVVGLPPQEAAKANASLVLLGVRRLADPQAAAKSREIAFAREAYRAEPLSATALSVMVSAMPADAKRYALLAEAGKLTRRNALLNEEQIKVAAKRGDDGTFFRWLSRSVLINNDLRSAYVGAMAQATGKAGAVAALAPVIGPEPSWSEFYWQQVVRYPASLANAARLRLAVAKQPWHQTDITPTDEKLMLALVSQRLFDTAQEFYRGLVNGRPMQGANLLANGDFAKQPQLAPFDWEVRTSGTLGATISNRDERLVVSAIGGARGTAARQLVLLSPGIYQLGWSLSSLAPIEASSITARISCAERGVKSVSPAPVVLQIGRRNHSFAIADGACRWHWLTIDVAVPDSGVGFDASFDDITLTRGVDGEDVGRTSIEENGGGGP